MSALHVWLSHPVTVGLGLLILIVVFLLTEILLRGLSDLGSVRFQGLVEDHDKLIFLQDSELAQSQTALRWLQWLFLALICLTLNRGFNLEWAAAILASSLIAVFIVLLAQFPFRTIREGGLARMIPFFRPLLSPLARLSRFGAPHPSENVEEEEEEASEREIRAFLDMGEAAGIIEGEEGEILESLVEFFDTKVREVMTPRTEMVSIPETAPWDELMSVFVETHKSRVPVYRETIDHIVGVVHVKQLIKDITSGKKPPVSQLHQPCPIVPESKELGSLLKEFQQEHQQMAIVVDEYGGTAGLVTLEDILEEIVGEIQDELDPRQPPEVEELSPGTYLLQGRAPLEVLEELFDLELETEDVDTIGGLVFSRFGSVPEPGTEVPSPEDGLLFRVVEMDGRRIVSVQVQHMNKSQGEET